MILGGKNALNLQKARECRCIMSTPETAICAGTSNLRHFYAENPDGRVRDDIFWLLAIREDLSSVSEADEYQWQAVQVSPVWGDNKI
jgi:hypothetical protein